MQVQVLRRNGTARPGLDGRALFQGPARRVAAAAASTSTSQGLQDAQAAVLNALTRSKGRGKEGLTPEQEGQLSQAVGVLEAGVGAADPTTLPQLDGMWRLLYTSRPGTSSPIQRTFTGVEAFQIFQEVDLTGPSPRVNNVVSFGADVGLLKVEALASTSSRPLAGFTPRRGAGLPLFGKSSVGPPARRNMRIDFQFDLAAFTFRKLPFSIPYPVPFRYLGDETKGWVDTTYMDEAGSFRLARGNKGTLFILQKDEGAAERVYGPGGGGSSSSGGGAGGPPVPPPDTSATPATPEGLLAAIEQGRPDDYVSAVIERVAAAGAAAGGGERAPARSAAVAGVWRLVWSAQSASASALQKWGTKQSCNYQVIDAAAGTLENVVDLGPLQVRAQATCAPAGDERTEVQIGGGALCLGGLRVPLPVKGTGFVDWLWLDGRVRVTRGSKGSVFVHVREPEGTVV